MDLVMVALVVREKHRERELVFLLTYDYRY
jgi:hypothetical protein